MMLVLFGVSVDSLVFLISVVLVVHVGGRIPLGLLGLLMVWYFCGLIFNCCCCDLWIVWCRDWIACVGVCVFGIVVFVVCGGGVSWFLGFLGCWLLWF